MNSAIETAAKFPHWISADGSIVLINADCRDVLPGLLGQRIDAVVTDPPYGIGVGGEWGSSNKGVVTDYGRCEWDHEPATPEAIAMLRRASRWQVIFGGNYFDLPPSRCWLVWDKLNTGDFADCELAWTNLDKAVRRIQFRWNGMIRDEDGERVHPTQKPIAVMRWAIEHCPDASLVCDPYMGSGTTGIACIVLGRRFIGIERERTYFDIAQRRIEEALSMPLFDQPTYVQKSLLDGAA